jgi:hypothetical protein
VGGFVLSGTLFAMPPRQTVVWHVPGTFVPVGVPSGTFTVPQQLMSHTATTHAFVVAGQSADVVQLPHAPLELELELDADALDVPVTPVPLELAELGMPPVPEELEVPEAPVLVEAVALGMPLLPEALDVAAPLPLELVVPPVLDVPAPPVPVVPVALVPACCPHADATNQRLRKSANEPLLRAAIVPSPSTGRHASRLQDAAEARLRLSDRRRGDQD